MRLGADPDVAKAREFAEAVRRATQKMKSFIQFKLIAGALVETSVAWFEPAHRVTELAAQFFVRRFAARRFSILTPDVCAHWNGVSLVFTAGCDPADTPGAAELDVFWQSRFAEVFESSPSGDRRTMRAAQRLARDGSYDELAAGVLRR